MTLLLTTAILGLTAIAIQTVADKKKSLKAEVLIEKKR